MSAQQLRGLTDEELPDYFADMAFRHVLNFKDAMEYNDPHLPDITLSAKTALHISKTESGKEESQIVNKIVNKILVQVYEVARVGKTSVLISHPVFNQLRGQEDKTARRAEVVLELRARGYEATYYVDRITASGERFGTVLVSWHAADES